MNKIHTAESDTKEIPEGRIVRTRCGKQIAFNSHGSKPMGGIICSLCSGFPMQKVGHPPFIFAVSELVLEEEKKPLTRSVSA